MSNALLYFGANELQLAALRFAREAGLEVVVVDEDPHSSGRRYADRFETLTSTDLDPVAHVARSLGRRLVGVSPSSDAWLAAATVAQEVAGLPGRSRATAEILADRHRTLALWRERGIPVAQDEHASPGTRTFSVEGFFHDEVYVPGGAGERFDVSAANPAGIRGSIPAEIGAVLESLHGPESLYEIVEQGARALGIAAGPVCARVRHTPQGPELLALSPRFDCGPFTAHATAFAYGKSPLQAWFAALAGAGGPFDVMPDRPERSAGWLALPATREGVLIGIEGADRARALPGCERILRLLPLGTKLRVTDDERGWVALAFASGKDAREVEERLARIRSRLEVKVECRSVA